MTIESKGLYTPGLWWISRCKKLFIPVLIQICDTNIKLATASWWRNFGWLLFSPGTNPTSPFLKSYPNDYVFFFFPVVLIKTANMATVAFLSLTTVLLKSFYHLFHIEVLQGSNPLKNIQHNSRAFIRIRDGIDAQ